ncbi:MAG: hypothetical protein HYY18_05830 [Planctomycetes bacterium]|nr:hypothetical protein [Planctomycetota bacterium]
MRPHAVLLVFALASLATPEPKKPRPDPALLAEFDLRGVREGEWVEYDCSLRSKEGKEERWSYRLACVGGGEETIRVETDRDQAGPEGSTWLVEAARADGSIRRYWHGKCGGAGEPVDAPRGRSPKPPVREGKGTVSRETLKIGDRELECVKLVCEVTETPAGGGEKDRETYRWTRWMAKEIPFPRRVTRDRLAWEGEPGDSGAIAKMVFEYSDGVVVTTIARAWGADAEATLAVPEPAPPPK